MRRHRLTLAVILPLVALVAACGEAADDDGTTPPPGDRPGLGALAGRTFLSTAVTEADVDRPLVDGTRIRLSFGEDGTLGANAGCNHLGGDVRVEGDRLLVGSLATTEMGCPPELHVQDEWLANLLTEEPTFTLDGPELRLTHGATVIELTDREVADPDRPLEGTVWELDSIIENDAVSSVPQGAGATLRFVEGRVEVSINECNQGSGAIEITDGTMEVSPIATTLIACAEPHATVEGAVMRVLRDTITYEIEADRLTLSHPDGHGISLRAAR